ncbi:hypothetical protein ACXX82_18935 [Glaciimonas sp. GNP009]
MKIPTRVMRPLRWRAVEPVHNYIAAFCQPLKSCQGRVKVRKDLTHTTRHEQVLWSISALPEQQTAEIAGSKAA